MPQGLPAVQRLRAPDRNREVGAAKSGLVSSLTAENVRLILSIATRATTPLSSAMVNANSRITTTTAETRGGANRLSWRTRNRTSLPTNCPISTNTNSTTMDSTAVSG